MLNKTNVSKSELALNLQFYIIFSLSLFYTFYQFVVVVVVVVVVDNINIGAVIS